MNPKNLSIKSLISSKKRIAGILIPPPDKSITHRAIFMASLSTKKSHIRNPLLSDDCLSTVRCLKNLGVPIKVKKNEIIVSSGEKSNFYPYRNLRKSLSNLNCGNSGTTMRLISGILAAQPFPSRLTGDASLSRRPMKRVIKPLTKMGGKISARDDNYAPLFIEGNPNIKPIFWESPIASAQVKTCVLLAGLFAKGKTTVSEPAKSRDHTERMLKSLGVKINSSNPPIRRTGQRKNFDANRTLGKKNSVSISGFHELKGLDLTIPGDFSSAAFFIASALIVPGSNLTIRNVNLNPTRAGILTVLKRMGAKIKVKNLKNVYNEPVGELQVEYSNLKSTAIQKKEIPLLIDEIPMISVIATQAKGTTTISGAEELRLKESDRLSAMASELSKMGAKIKEKRDGLIIHGPVQLHGTKVKSYSDHRIAMSLAIAALIADGTTKITNFNCVKISFPDFLKKLKNLIKEKPSRT